MDKNLYETVIAEIIVQFGAGDYIEPGDREACAELIVGALEKTGYRKADEVRKETAKEIVDLLIQYDDGDSNTQAIELVVERFGLQDYVKENFFVQSDDEEDDE